MKKQDKHRKTTTGGKSIHTYKVNQNCSSNRDRYLEKIRELTLDSTIAVSFADTAEYQYFKEFLEKNKQDESMGWYTFSTQEQRIINSLESFKIPPIGYRQSFSKGINRVGYKENQYSLY